MIPWHNPPVIRDHAVYTALVQSTEQFGRRQLIHTSKCTHEAWLAGLNCCTVYSSYVRSSISAMYGTWLCRWSYFGQSVVRWTIYEYGSHRYCLRCPCPQGRSRCTIPEQVSLGSKSPYSDRQQYLVRLQASRAYNVRTTKC